MPPASGAPEPAVLETRQLQTRRYAELSEERLLAACAGVLQDLGFNLDESETELGLIVASKERTASAPVQATAALVLRLLFDIDLSVDDRQQIRVSLVTRAIPESPGSHVVRVTFQRIVWNDDNMVSRREALHAPELYQQFFTRLSHSVFLEAQET